jgi:hypothetical protein
MTTEPLIEEPTPVNPTRARRAHDGRLALYFPPNERYGDPIWLLVAIRGDLYVEILAEEDVADWAEVEVSST